MADEIKRLVIDNGSGLIKAGFGGEDAPISVFPSIIGKNTSVLSGVDQKDYFVGSEAEQKGDLLKLTYPIDHGIISNWDNMEKIWNHIFYNELKVNPEEHPTLLTDVSKNPKSNREKMTQIMFETFNTPSFYVKVQGVLALQANGRTTGIVFDSGDGVSSTLPVQEGYSVPYAISRIDFAGRDLTDQMEKILMENGYSFITSDQKENIKNIKETLSFIALDYDKTMEEAKDLTKYQKAYELPDGQIIQINSERFRCPEVLFKPNFIGKQFSGIHKMIYDSIMNSDIDIRRDLQNNIILNGGNTMYDGIEQRLTRELKKLAPQSVKIYVVSNPARKQNTWIGGSILSSLSFFNDKWIEKGEYDEYGPRIVHRKCN